MDHVSEIKSRVNIEDLVAQYVTLKKAGRDFKALCPFHQEKTPSFFVSPEKQIAYCFGCHRGGDIFKFLCEIENIEFFEALKLLADRSGVKLPEKFVTEKKGKRDRLKALHEEAAEFYKEKLWSKEGEDPLSYLLKKRKFSKETVKKFRFGFSPYEGGPVITHLLNKGFSKEEIVESGIGIQKNISNDLVVDRFHGRLMIPIFDVYGDVIAFGARALRDEDQPKYLNSPETSLYEKSSVLYALNFAKEAIKKSKAVLVEGYMDVVRCHEMGILNAVASCGTALTGRHAKLLKRFTADIVLFFDGDEAGRMATIRAFETVNDLDFIIRVLRPPVDRDPDDWVKADASEVKNLLQEAPLFFDFLFEQSMKRFNLAKIDEQKKAIAEIFPFLTQVKSSIELDQYLQKLSHILKTQPKALYSELIRFKGTSERVKETFQAKTSQFQTSEYLLGCFLQYPETWEIARASLKSDDFEGDQNRLYKAIENIYNTPRKPEEDIFLLISEDLRERAKLLALFSEAQNGEMSYSGIYEEVKRATKKFLREKQEEEKKRLLFRIKESQAERDHRSLDALIIEYQELLRGEKV